jgi:hypothetical protein
MWGMSGMGSMGSMGSMSRKRRMRSTSRRVGRGFSPLLFCLLAAPVILGGCAGEKRSMPSAAPGGGSFETQVVPLLRARCSPCHFAGGKMYDKLPFDRPGTIRTLGVKLFTRIKDPGDQAVIRAFLDQAD